MSRFWIGFFLFCFTGLSCFAKEPVIKAGHHVGFDRLVFNTQTFLPFKIHRYDTYSVLSFSKALKIDLGEIYKIIAPSLKKMSLKSSPKQTDLILSNYPKDRKLTAHSFKGGVYFDLYWPELKQECPSLKISSLKGRTCPSKEKFLEQFSSNDSSFELLISEMLCQETKRCSLLRLLNAPKDVAIFEKDAALWIVFPKILKTQTAFKNTKTIIQKIKTYTLKNGTAFRLSYADGYEPVLIEKGSIQFSPKGTVSRYIAKNMSSAHPLLTGEGVVFHLGKKLPPIRFTDPVVGNEVVVFPDENLYNPSSYRFDFVEIPPSFQGLAFISWTEALGFKQTNGNLSPLP
ncbi:MAG: hypothetical protein PHI50_01070 [Alphaproteobacteria bacterium]|nr:hypothetical protein [Alphaproteobacteria bacterium]